MYSKSCKRQASGYTPFLNHVSSNLCIVLVYYFCKIVFFLSAPDTTESGKMKNLKVMHGSKTNMCYSAQSNNVSLWCFQDKLLLVFIKPSARMANSFTFVLFGVWGGGRGCVYCLLVLLCFICRYI